MDFEFTKVVERNETYIEITKFKKNVDVMEIPMDIDGVPICSVKQSALAFAKNIKLFIIHAKDSDYSLGRSILNQTYHYFRIRFILPEGDLELAFPEFYSNYIENTPARVIHLKIEGNGFAYRECVLRNHIDTTNYDSLFNRTIKDGIEVAADVALSRLKYPLNLLERNKRTYEEYVSENIEGIASYLIKENDRDRLSFLVSNFSVSPEEKMKMLKLAVDEKRPALTAVIMKGQGIQP